MRFNPPPGWPAAPAGWQPPSGWTPDPAWPALPDGWQLWVRADGRDHHGAEAVQTQLPAAPEGRGADAEDVANLRAQVSLLQQENHALREQLRGDGPTAEEFVILDDEMVLQTVGIYRYHHPLENAAGHRQHLDRLTLRIAESVKAGTAIAASNLFAFDNSLAKGRKMVADLSALMLRAYNAEADNSIRTLRLGNVVTAKKRLDASRTSIARLGRMMEMHISDSFHGLRLEEIELTADWLMKVQEEKEAAREERARLREERKVAQELAAERARLDKERAHLANALATLRASGGSDAELQAQLTAIDDAIAQNDYRTANIRAGYVYVISNRGAFGGHVVKIGLTRRLDPLDRVSELGGASVPFRFDVHALFFSDDAVGVETQLHRHFAGQAVNQANHRKEFFFASPAEVKKVLADTVGTALLEFNETAEATEYLQSVSSWPVAFGAGVQPEYVAMDGPID